MDTRAHCAHWFFTPPPKQKKKRAEGTTSPMLGHWASLQTVLSFNNPMLSFNFSSFSLCSTRYCNHIGFFYLPVNRSENWNRVTARRTSTTQLYSVHALYSLSVRGRGLVVETQERCSITRSPNTASTSSILFHAHLLHSTRSAKKANTAPLNSRAILAGVAHPRHCHSALFPCCSSPSLYTVSLVVRFAILQTGQLCRSESFRVI